MTTMYCLQNRRIIGTPEFQERLATSELADEIWCEITDRFRINSAFTVRQAVEVLDTTRHLEYRTARDYIRVVLNNVEAQGKETGDPQIKRVRNSWVLTDANP